MLDNSEIGARLRAIREAKRLSITAFAKEAGVDVSQYSKAEKGEKGLGRQKFMDLCSTWNINAGYVLTGKGPMFLDQRADAIGSADTTDPKEITLPGTIQVTLADHFDLLKKTIQQLEQDKEFLKRMLEANLIGLAEGQQKLSAQIMALFDRAVHLEAPDDPQKQEAMMLQIYKWISERLPGNLAGDIHIDAGKLRSRTL